MFDSCPAKVGNELTASELGSIISVDDRDAARLVLATHYRHNLFSSRGSSGVYGDSKSRVTVDESRDESPFALIKQWTTNVHVTTFERIFASWDTSVVFRASLAPEDIFSFKSERAGNIRISAFTSPAGFALSYYCAYLFSKIGPSNPVSHQGIH